MYTQQVKRKKGNLFMEMHTLGNVSNLGITKLGSSLITSMQSLQSKKKQILETTNISRLLNLFADFKKQHNNFLQLQKNFFELDQSTPQTDKLKIRIKTFLQNIKVEQVQNKLEVIKKQKVKQSQRLQIMNKVQGKNKGDAGTQLMMDNQQLIRQKLLDEQLQELKLIEKLIADIKSIAIKTSTLIYEQGVNLNIAAQTIKSARQKFKQGKDELVQANQYQQDTGRQKMYLCVLGIVIVLVILMLIWANSSSKQ